MKEGKSVILAGDANVAPEPCDIWGVKHGAEWPSCKPYELKAYADFISRTGMVDVYKHKKPKLSREDHTWKGSGGKMSGRIDHTLCTPDMLDPLSNVYIESIKIHPSLLGSDHHPVEIGIVVRDWGKKPTKPKETKESTKKQNSGDSSAEDTDGDVPDLVSESDSEEESTECSDEESSEEKASNEEEAFDRISQILQDARDDLTPDPADTADHH